MRILFVCTGNTCRSPMAEGYFRYLIEKNNINNITVMSAGTYAYNGESPSPNAVKAVGEYGVDIANHSSSALTKEMVDEADLIITMTGSHRQQIIEAESNAASKVHLLNEYSENGGDISDPFGGGIEIYKMCFSTMLPALEGLLKNIEKNSK